MVTYTSTYNLRLPAVGQDDDVWGGYVNDNTNALESILTGNTTITNLVITTADINGGTLDNVVIGGSTPAAITGTTITADGLTVDTNTLHVDATNNRVGVGTSAPNQKVEISDTSTADVALRMTNNDGNLEIQKYQDDLAIKLNDTGDIIIRSALHRFYSICVLLPMAIYHFTRIQARLPSSSGMRVRRA